MQQCRIVCIRAAITQAELWYTWVMSCALVLWPLTSLYLPQPPQTQPLLCLFFSSLCSWSQYQPPPSPPFSFLPLLPLPSILFTSQGLSGRCPFCFPSRRGGECERNHLQRKSRNTRPGAAGSEGAGGGSQPWLSARWEEILDLKLHWHNAPLLGSKTCTNKLWFESPLSTCGIYDRMLSSHRQS